MAFNAANFSAVNVAGSDTLPFVLSVVFKYTTTDTLATVEASGYFNSVGFNPVRHGDFIAVEANDGNVLLQMNVSASLSSPTVSVGLKVANLSDFTFLFGSY